MNQSIQWQKIYHDQLAYRANMVKDLLINEQIMAIVVPKKDSSYQLGIYEVHVNREDVLKAIKLIQDDIRFDEIE